MVSAKDLAIAVIKREHRTLGAVVNNMKGVLDAVLAGRMPMDHTLMWAMVHYIDAFPNVQHHPKEDQCLFVRLRQRTDQATDLIACLQAEHQQEAERLHAIRRALGNQEAGVEGALGELHRDVNDYAEATWHHLRTEEQVLLPLAEAVLTDDDWDALAHAFGQNPEPQRSASPGTALDRVFHDILLRTPAPLGLGLPQPHPSPNLGH